jgi:hypothetical protein
VEAWRVACRDLLLVLGGLIEVECREGKVAPAGVFMPLRNRVVADMVSNLIEFEILLLFGLYRDHYY